MAERTGKRRTREQLSKRRIPELGYYFIVTNAKETEKNYIRGLRDSMPQKLQGKLVIKVSEAETEKLIEEAQYMVSIQPQYGEPWIVFDRDQVKGFDQIVASAQEKGIKAGWSNPCIEIWFSAYFGAMPVYDDSVACCDGFERQYLRTAKHKYIKADAAIYSKLCIHGDEEQAIKIAERKYREHESNGRTKPSDMCPCTTIHRLIKEIKEKIDKDGSCHAGMTPLG